MCGFITVRTPNGATVSPRAVEKATRSIVHRGPDDEGFYYDNNVGFGFRRLSIIDLSDQSHQPFEDVDGRYVMVFNGEIYNYLELRDELKAKGHSFRTSGDTEVLLTAFKEWGQDCVNRLNGMWAFIIYDQREKELFGSRDRFGIKPLYRARVGESQIFASEIKGVFATEMLDREINWQTAASYLLDGRISSAVNDNETFFKNIQEIPAGHCFSVDRHGRYKSWPFWELPDEVERAEAAPIDTLHDLLRDSVTLRMRSDVPVGVCLSGGIDSTSIICLMAEALGNDRAQPLNAFSYIDEQFDESKEIQATIDATGATLHRLSGNVDTFLDKLTEVLRVHDEPFHSLNVLISYELYRMASKADVKVILNGQGADECWAGYPPYFYNYWHSLISSRQFSRLWQEIRDYSSMHQTSQISAWRKTVKMLLRDQLRRSAKYREYSARRARREATSHPWFTGDLSSFYVSEVTDDVRLDIHSHLRRSVKKHSLPLYLRVEDRNSMAHSIETRLPFLDYRVVSLALTSSGQWLLKGGWNKFALREAMNGVIPEVVRNRKDKMGFPVSARDWFAGPLYNVVRDVVGSSRSRQSSVLDVDRILRDLDRHRKGEVDCSDRLLRVLQLQMLSDSAR